VTAALSIGVAFRKCYEDDDDDCATSFTLVRLLKSVPTSQLYFHTVFLFIFRVFCVSFPLCKQEFAGIAIVFHFLFIISVNLYICSVHIYTLICNLFVRGKKKLLSSG